MVKNDNDAGNSADRVLSLPALDRGEAPSESLERAHAYAAILSEMSVGLGDTDPFGRYLLGMASQHFLERLGPSVIGLRS